MTEPRRPRTPPQPKKAAPAAKRTSTPVKSRRDEQPTEAIMTGPAARLTHRAKQAGRSAGAAAKAAGTSARSAGAAARANARPSTPRSSSTLAAHRPDPGTPPVPTPWAKVAAGSAANVTTRMQERLRERRSAHTRLLAIRWGKRAAIALGAAAAVWLVMMSPVFAFDSSEVDAAGFGSVVDPEQVQSVIAAHDGTSLAMLDTGGIAAEIEQLVGVREVSIARVWPSGLRVEILASEPVAAIPQEGGEFVLVDDQGVPVDSAAEAPQQLPVVTIPIEKGETRILAGVLDVIDELPVELRDRVEGIEANTEDSIHFVLRDGPSVEWGSGEDSALKAEVLQVLLDSPEASSADVIDVSAPSLPITRAE